MNRYSRTQSGVTLIEVLVSAALMSMVLIWISDAHIKSLNDISNTSQRTQAMWLAEELLERAKLAPCDIPKIKTELASANSGSYCNTLQNCVGSTCTLAQMSKYNVQQVFCNNKSDIRNLAMGLKCYDALTNAEISTCAGNNRAEMTASWDAAGKIGGGYERKETTVAMLLRTAPLAERFTTSRTVAIPECCGSPITDTMEVIAPNRGDWCKMVVEIDLHHTYIGDLLVSLTSPDGQNYVISNRQGGATRTVPDQIINRATDLSTATTNGNWTLKIEDRAGQDIGELQGWTVRFE
ncbi:proprotein convertase P-domain-containing protein [Endozoicomonas sp. Mp262]|uniref:proprotein convertase P-domain-containing protein n=1 Tax=Endozoicomonas sp. Mp262 TaxID=2919499 RepID=UPI0021DB2B8B